MKLPTVKKPVTISGKSYKVALIGQFFIKIIQRIPCGA